MQASVGHVFKSARKKRGAYTHRWTNLQAAASAQVQSLMPKGSARTSFTAPQSLFAENEKEGEMVDPMEAHRASRVSDRDDEAQFLKSTLYSARI